MLADRPDTHRTAMVKAVDAEVITKEEVYTPEVACMMWHIFGGRARKLGYSLPPWITKAQCRTAKYDWGRSLLAPKVVRAKQRQLAAARQAAAEKQEEAAAAAAEQGEVVAGAKADDGGKKEEEGPAPVAVAAEKESTSGVDA